MRTQALQTPTRQQFTCRDAALPADVPITGPDFRVGGGLHFWREQQPFSPANGTRGNREARSWTAIRRLRTDNGVSRKINLRGPRGAPQRLSNARAGDC